MKLLTDSPNESGPLAHAAATSSPQAVPNPQAESSLHKDVRQPPSAKQSPTKMKLWKKLSYYRVKVHRLKQKLLKQELKNKKPTKSTEKKITNIGKAMSELVDGQKYDFIMSQIKNAHRKSSGKRWNYKDKSFALSLLHSSPKTYHLLRNVFDLPAPRTLKLNIY